MSNADPFELLVEAWEPALRQAFLSAIAEIRGRINVSIIAELLERGDIEGAIRSVGLNPLDFRGIDQGIHGAFNAGGTAYSTQVPAARLPEGTAVNFRFDARNPQAEMWVRDRSANLITEIIDDQKAAIRNHLVAGMEAGTNPRAVAVGLAGRRNPATGQRQGGIIGLTSLQEQWQRNYQNELSSADPAKLQAALERGLRDKRFDGAIRKAIATGKPIPAQTVAKMVAAYRNKSLKYRADLIAKHEALTALAASQRETFRQAILKGNVAYADVRRFAITAGDERVRHAHRLIPKMNEEGVGFDEPFKTIHGPRMETPFDVGCRCHIVYRIDYFRTLK